MHYLSSYDYLASKTGAIIVPTCGFDCIPADILVFLSNRTLKSILGPDAEPGLSQTFYGVEGGVSGGSIATLMSDIETVPRHVYAAGQRDYALSLGAHPLRRPVWSLRLTLNYQSGGIRVRVPRSRHVCPSHLLRSTAGTGLRGARTGVSSSAPSASPTFSQRTPACCSGRHTRKKWK